MRSCTIVLCLMLCSWMHALGQGNLREGELVAPINIEASGSMDQMELSWTKPSEIGNWESGWVSVFQAQNNAAYDDVAVLFDYSKMGYTFDFPCKLTKITQHFASFGGDPADLIIKVTKADMTTVLFESEVLSVDAAANEAFEYTLPTPLEVNEPFVVIMDAVNAFSLYPKQSSIGEFGPHSYFFDAWGAGWTEDNVYEVMMAAYLENADGSEVRLSNAKEALTGYRVYLDGAETPFASLNDAEANTWTVENMPSGLHTVRMSAVYGAEESVLSNRVKFFSDAYCAAGADKMDEYFTDIKIGDYTYTNTNEEDTYINLGNDGTVQVELNKGRSYQVELTNAKHYVEDDMGFWIDWAQDENFDQEGDEQDIHYSTATSVGKFILTVPADAPTGKTRIRMRVTSGTDIQPCGMAEWGQVIDLTAEIVEKPYAQFNLTQDRIGVNEELIINDNSLNASESWAWNFGADATPATLELTADTYQEEVSVQYSSLGEKNITLEVDDASTAQKTVKVVRGSADYAAPSYLQATEHAANVEFSWIGAGEHPMLAATEGFEGIFPPAGWEIMESSAIDAAPTAAVSDFKWTQCNADYMPDYVKPSSKYAAYIQNLAAGYQWLVTPAFEVLPQDVLSYGMAFYNYHGPLGVAYCNFYTMIKEEGQTEWTQLKAFGEDDPQNVYATPVEIALNAYAGKNVKIAFVYESKGYSFGMDDVKINNASTKRMALNPEGLEAYQLFRDNELVATITDLDARNYTDENVAQGVHTYEINAKYAAGESYPSNEVSAEVIPAVASLPYSMDFEGDAANGSWTMDNGWAIGTNSELSSDDFNFDGNDTEFAGINSDASSERLTAYLVTPPFNLAEYGWVDYSFTYKFEKKDKKSQLQIRYRKSSTEPWIKLKELPASADWREYHNNLPADLLADGVQLAFYYTDAKLRDLGAGIDNFNLTFNEGKHLTVKNAFNEVLTSGGDQNIGRVTEGNKREVTYTIYNSGMDAINISDVTLADNTNFSIKTSVSGAIEKGASADLTIEFAPASEGEHNCLLSIASDVSDDPFTVNMLASQGEAEWTWMLYLYEDGTGLDGLKDFNEWEVNGSIPGILNYVVLYDSDDDAKDGIYYVKRDPEGMNNILVSEKISMHMNNGLDMNKYTTLEEFGTWAVDHFPAKHYGLTVWDHGSGIFKSAPAQWKSAVGDMTLWDMNKALTSITATAGKKIDIFGFDVCLMGQVESAYQLKDNVDYVTFSEKTEPADGWDYIAAFARLNEHPETTTPEEICQDIVDTYIASYSPGGSAYVAEATQSAVSIDKLMEVFVPAMNDFAAKLSAELMEHKAEIKAARDAAYNSAENVHHKDLGHFAQLILDANISEDLNAAAQAMLDAHTVAVVAEGHTSQITVPIKGMKIWMTEMISTNLNLEFYTNEQEYLTISETRWDDYLRLYENPVAVGTLTPNFASSKNEIIRDEIIRIQDLTVANPFGETYKYTIDPAEGWSYVNGTNENSQCPMVQFTAEGSYDVILEVTAGDQAKLAFKPGFIVVNAPDFEAPGFLTYEKVADKRVKLDWVAPGEDPNSTQEWFGYSNVDECVSLVMFEETAVEFNANDFDYTTPAKIKKLSFAFYEVQNGTNNWTNNKFRFKVYNADRTEVLLETEEITAESNVEVIYTLPEPLEVSGNFVVSAYRSAADCSPHSLLKSIPKGTGHSYVFQTSDQQWHKATTPDEDWEFPARVYLSYANDADVASTSKTVAVEYAPLPETWTKYVVEAPKAKASNLPALRGDGSLSAYRVYRDGEMIAELDDLENLTYTDEVTEVGVYNYHVTAVYTAPDGESAASNEVAVNFGVGLNEVNVNNCHIYPNPVADHLNIILSEKVNETATVEIYGLDGKVEMAAAVNLVDGMARIKNINLNTGMYLLKVKMNDSTIVQKLSVK